MNLPAWQLDLLRPAGLAALVAVLPVLYYFRRSLANQAPWQRWASLATRFLLVAVLATALCGLVLTWWTHQQMVVFAIDQSGSVGDEARSAANAFLDEALKTKGDNDVLFLPFAAAPGKPSAERPQSPPADPNATDLAAALTAARAALPETHVPQVVLLTDGNETNKTSKGVGSLYFGSGENKSKDSRPLYCVAPLAGRPRDEVAVAAVDLPRAARQGMAFPIDVVVQATGDNAGRVVLLHGGKPVAEEKTQVHAGENRVHFTQSLVGRERETYSARLEGFRDTWPENNELRATMTFLPKPRILLVEGQPGQGRPLAAALEKENIDVDLRSPEAMPGQRNELEKYPLVLLANVRAAALPTERMKLLQAYVADGGGLVATGGDQSFTPGGYRGTVLEEALPVLSEAHKEKPKPRLAMVLVLDRSASMAGKSIELARQATRQAVEMLSPQDQIGVLAFEDNSYWVSELAPCSDKSQVLRRIDTLAAAGGTSMFPAMEKAFLALRESYADLKHMIVMTDGLSHPGDFEALTRSIAGSGITVSTVGVGPEVAPALLKDIADRGHGHYYYCADAAAVPQAFALETISAGRVGISEEPFFPQVGDAKDLFAGLDLAHAPSLLGYVETQPKPASRVILATKEGDPLLATARVGKGLAVAFTSDATGRWAADWQRWPGYGPFWGQVVRHALRPDDFRHVPPVAQPPGYADEYRLRETNVELLRKLAETTGGRYAPAPAAIFAPTDRTVPRRASLWYYLLTAAVVLFAIDVVLKRLP